MISFWEALIASLFVSLGVCPYKPRQIASKMVVLPEPVGPDIKNRPDAAISGSSKFIFHSPARELKLRNLTLICAYYFLFLES